MFTLDLNVTVLEPEKVQDPQAVSGTLGCTTLGCPETGVCSTNYCNVSWNPPCPTT